MKKQKKALIIGAGPAGLTAAFEFLDKTNIKPLVFEKSTYMGGIARTVNYKGNRIDIGGHRFFSKSDRVMNWWLSMFPPERITKQTVHLSYQGKDTSLSPQNTIDATTQDNVMLIRQRKSRIYFLRKFFEYPLALNLTTIRGLGLWRTARIGMSYSWAHAFPIKPEKNLEEFYINRFGKELYKTFFEKYTEKVWGVPCNQISAEWGAQRVKGLSIKKALFHALTARKKGDLSQKQIETSLIEQFLYPKYGPGQLWEEVAKKVQEKGGEIQTEKKIVAIGISKQKVTYVVTEGAQGKKKKIRADYFLSTMPIQELIRAIQASKTLKIPSAIKKISEGLQYRDFLTVGLLLKKMNVHEETPEGKKLIRDNWLYIQEPDVQVGRIQIFNNWSPYLVKDPNTVWIGLEYFCKEKDSLWKLSDEKMIELAKKELVAMKLIDSDDVLDATVIRMEKTYPAYFGTYSEFDTLRKFLDSIKNLYLIGRNGMHRYNNQDHSMLTAMLAVENIQNNITSKENLWKVNTEQEYHEEKK